MTCEGRWHDGGLRVPALVAAIVLLGALALAAALPAAADAKPRGAALDLRLERNPVIVNDSYRRLPEVGRAGATGANLHSSTFSISHQALGDIYVRAGLIHDKPRLIRDGFEVFDYAFRKQFSGGGFPDTSQAEAYAFFVEAVAHSGLLIEESKYAGRYRDKLRRYRKRTERAARQIGNPAAFGAFKGRNGSYTHSGYVVGTALGLAGRFVGSRGLRSLGRKAIAAALDNQRSNGVNPELGGYDVRYQMAGIVYAERYSVYFPTGSLSRRVQRMVDKGIRWMDGRVDKDGYIRWRGSSRSCREQNSNGNPKTPGYAYAIRGFAYWGALQGDGSLVDDARDMRRYTKRTDKSLCGPKDRTREIRPPGRRRGERDSGNIVDQLLDPRRFNDLLE